MVLPEHDSQMPWHTIYIAKSVSVWHNNQISMKLCVRLPVLHLCHLQNMKLPLSEALRRHIQCLMMAESVLSMSSSVLNEEQPLNGPASHP